MNIWIIDRTKNCILIQYMSVLHILGVVVGSCNKNKPPKFVLRTNPSQRIVVANNLVLEQYAYASKKIPWESLEIPPFCILAFIRCGDVCSERKSDDRTSQASPFYKHIDRHSPIVPLSGNLPPGSLLLPPAQDVIPVETMLCWFRHGVNPLHTFFKN